MEFYWFYRHFVTVRENLLESFQKDEVYGWARNSSQKEGSKRRCAIIMSASSIRWFLIIVLSRLLLVGFSHKLKWVASRANKESLGVCRVNMENSGAFGGESNKERSKEWGRGISLKLLLCSHAPLFFLLYIEEGVFLLLLLFFFFIDLIHICVFFSLLHPIGQFFLSFLFLLFSFRVLS